MPVKYVLLFLFIIHCIDQIIWNESRIPLMNLAVDDTSNWPNEVKNVF